MPNSWSRSSWFVFAFLLFPLNQVPKSGRAEEARPGNWFPQHFFGRGGMRSACPADPCICVTRSLVLRVDLGDTEEFKMLWCVWNYIYIRVYMHQCIYTSEKHSSHVIYARKLLQERKTKLWEVYLAVADDFWKHFDLQWCVGVWNSKHALFTFSIIIIAWLLMTSYSKFENI